MMASTVLKITLVLIFTAVAATSRSETGGLTAAWSFDALRRGMITTEKASPGTAAWDGFTRVSAPSATDCADAHRGNGVTFTALTPLASPSVAPLNDGNGQRNGDSPPDSFFFSANGKDNRILIDLHSLQMSTD